MKTRMQSSTAMNVVKDITSTVTLHEWSPDPKQTILSRAPLAILNLCNQHSKEVGAEQQAGEAEAEAEQQQQLHLPLLWLQLQGGLGLLLVKGTI